VASHAGDRRQLRIGRPGRLPGAGARLALRCWPSRRSRSFSVATEKLRNAALGAVGARGRSLGIGVREIEQGQRTGGKGRGWINRERHRRDGEIKGAPGGCCRWSREPG